MLNIVLGEDNAAEVVLLQLALKEYHIPVNTTACKDGFELLEYLTQPINCSTDFILLDLNMPKVNGLEALARIRLLPCFNDTPIIILSSSSNPKDIEKALEAGANEYLTKSVDFFEFSDKLIEVLNKYVGDKV
jgi:two-component system, chemotaxis family, response regulator Rcp1